LLILRSDSPPANLHPDYVCTVVRNIVDASMRGRPFKELVMFLEVALSNLRVFVDPDDVALVFASACD